MATPYFVELQRTLQSIVEPQKHLVIPLHYYKHLLKHGYVTSYFVEMKKLMFNTITELLYQIHQRI